MRVHLFVLFGCAIGMRTVADQLVSNMSDTNNMAKVVNKGDIPIAGEPKTNGAGQKMLCQRLGGSVSETLLKNQFVLWENVMLRRERISVGELKIV
jgi:hypothetical protein